jgi:hypothetical protein
MGIMYQLTQAAETGKARIAATGARWDYPPVYNADFSFTVSFFEIEGGPQTYKATPYDDHILRSIKRFFFPNGDHKEQ